MSKAKELARALREATTATRYRGHTTIEFFDQVEEFISEVLSEPDKPDELKGWIEVTDQGLLMSVNINQIEWFGGQRIRLASGDNPEIRLLRVKESYEELKQKIKEAQ